MNGGGAAFIGVDVGGTNLAAGAVDEQGRLLSKISIPTPADSGGELLCREILRAARLASQQAGFPLERAARLGLGIPGAVDRARGLVLHMPNLSGKELALGQMLEKACGVPVVLENDANCAAIGEYTAGAARGCRTAMVITLGTGVGAGLIVDGALYTGADGMGLEAGHMVIEVDGRPCNCGRRGCWERYSSATGLKQTARQAMLDHRDSLMWELTEGEPERLSGRIPFQAARLGDEAGRQVVEEYLRYLSVGLANMINCFQPQVLCLGGGVSNEADDLFLDPLSLLVEREVFNPGHTRLVKAQLGNDAGIVGAAVPFRGR